MHKQEFALENGTHKISFNSGIQTDHPIPDRRLDEELTDKEKRTCVF